MFNNLAQVLNFIHKDIQQCTVLVIGDVMLDQYYFSDVQRISPEAPVPVAKVVKEKITLGGAANVAHNLVLLGCRVVLGGVAGNDDNQRKLALLLASKGIDGSGLICVDKPTITKMRVIGANQQMLRLDFEENGPLADDVLVQLKSWYEAALAQADAVVISDYAKGVCAPELCKQMINLANQRSVPVLIDPKGDDWSKYAGAAYITPNMKELCEAVQAKVANDDREVYRYASEIIQRYAIANVVVTRSEQGLSLINSQAVHIPTLAEEVFDVSGAGDTVAAVLAAGIAGRLDPSDAARLANLAAGVVVARVGTYAISKDELLAAIRQRSQERDFDRKILASAEEAVYIVNMWRGQGADIVFTNGCFDILHAGHVSYLEKAKRLGTKLIVGLNSDASVQRLKGHKRPVVSEQDRATVIAALACVDAVVLFDQDTPAELIQKIKPDILAKGGDYTPDTVVGREDAGRVEIIAFEAGKSTTGIIEKIVAAYND